MDPSVFGVSWVKKMWGSIQLMWCRNWMLCSAFWMTKVSSTYLSHYLGKWVAVLLAMVLKSSHKQVGHNGADGRFHGCPMHIFIILTLEEEIGVLRHNSNRVVMYCISLDVLRCSYVSCFNLWLIMEIARSTGTVVKKAFYHKMKCIPLSQDWWIWHGPQSPGCSWYNVRNVLQMTWGCWPSPWPPDRWLYPTWILYGPDGVSF